MSIKGSASVTDYKDTLICSNYIKPSENYQVYGQASFVIVVTKFPFSFDIFQINDSITSLKSISHKDGTIHLSINNVKYGYSPLKGILFYPIAKFRDSVFLPINRIISKVEIIAKPYIHLESFYMLKIIIGSDDIILEMFDANMRIFRYYSDRIHR